MRVDFGELVRLKLKQFNFMPFIGITASSLQNGTFAYSADDVTYTTFNTIDGSVHAGWNYFVFDDGEEISGIRYLKYTGMTSESKCRLAEVAVKGWVLYKDDLALTGAACPVTLNVNGIAATGSGTVTYKSSLTPLVTGLSPAYGKQPGGDTLVITGTGFGTDKSKVKVTASGVDCPVTAVTATQITCTTGDYDQYQIDNAGDDSMSMSAGDFVVAIDG
jgi:IPT/TIG domain